MRLVLELRTDVEDVSCKHLCCVKGNYLSAEYKTESIKLKFSENLTFSETGERVPYENLLPISSDNETKYNAIKQFQDEGLTLDQIAKKVGYKDKSGVSKFLGRYEKQNNNVMDKFDYVALTNEVVRRNINLFGTFDGWTKGAFALSNLGEDGRVLFKKISQLSDKYKENENERKFTNALHTANKIGIASFIYMCQQKGIDTNKFYLKDAREGEMLIAKARNELVEKPPAYVDISGQYVDNSLDKHQESDFILFLKGLMNDVDKVEKAITAYRIGVTKLHHTIFWYIDVEGKVCYGKLWRTNQMGIVTMKLCLKAYQRCWKCKVFSPRIIRLNKFCSVNIC